MSATELLINDNDNPVVLSFEHLFHRWRRWGRSYTVFSDVGGWRDKFCSVKPVFGRWWRVCAVYFACRCSGPCSIVIGTGDRFIFKAARQQSVVPEFNADAGTIEWSGAFGTATGTTVAPDAPDFFGNAGTLEWSVSFGTATGTTVAPDAPDFFGNAGTLEWSVSFGTASGTTVAPDAPAFFGDAGTIEWSIGFGTATDTIVELPSATDFPAANIGTLGDFVVPVVESGRRYVVEVALIGADGQTAIPVDFFYQVVGKTAKPGVVTNGSINAHGEISTLSWTPPSDIDISHYQIRHSSETVNANYSNSVTLVTSVSRPATSVQVPTRNGTYFIRSYDKSGNASDGVEAVILYDDAAFLRGYNVVEKLD